MRSGLLILIVHGRTKSDTIQFKSTSKKKEHRPPRHGRPFFDATPTEPRTTMPRPLDPSVLETGIKTTMGHALDYILSPPAAYELSFLVLAVLTGFVLGKFILQRNADMLGAMRPEMATLVRLNLVPALCCSLVWFIEWLLRMDGFRTVILDTAGNLLLAWVAMRTVSCLVFSHFWARFISTFLWIFASLNIMGILDPLISLTERFGFTLGDVRVNLPMVVKATIFLFILTRLGFWFVNIVANRLERLHEVSPSNRLLIVKLLKSLILIMAVVATLDEVGVDLGALAILTGTIGVGLGFGLQKIIANLVSGLILLSDKSLRPGDVIQIGQIYGWVASMNARYTLVATRDGTELLIPNEEFITSRVVNWSHSSPNMRIKIPISIAYGSDLDKAKAIMRRAASNTDRVLAAPLPVTRLRRFGDNALELELRIWIGDPENGTSLVIDNILSQIYHDFAQAGIEIPFPQRDVRMHVVGDHDGKKKEK